MLRRKIWEHDVAGAGEKGVHVEAGCGARGRKGNGFRRSVDHVGKREVNFRTEGKEGNTYTLMIHLH